jgi:hypothetical protein
MSEPGPGERGLSEPGAGQPTRVLVVDDQALLRGSFRLLVNTAPDLTAVGEAGTGVRVLILTTFDLDEYVYSALHAGASGFLLKNTPPAELLTAIRVVASGESLLAPTVTRRLIAEFTRRPRPSRPPADELHGLTGREAEVLGLIAR